MPKKKQVFEPENLESIRSAISGLIVEPPETIEPVVYSVDLLSRHDPYYPMVQGEATSRLAMTATRNMAINPITGDAVIEDEGFRAFFEGYDGLKIGLTVGAQKLLSTAALYLTQNNHYRPEESARIQTEVQIPLISYARLLGYPVDERETSTPEEAEKEKRRIKNLMKDVRGKINDQLDVLYSLSLSWSEKKGRVSDYQDVRLLQRKGVKRGMISIQFSDDIARYLLCSYVMQYPEALLSIDERSPRAYRVGYKLAYHSSVRRNIERGTADIISVSALLDACGDIPDFDEVQKTDRGHWENRIKTPLETALDSCVRAGVLDGWEYCGAKKAKLSDSEVDIGDYATFIGLYVRFRMGRMRPTAAVPEGFEPVPEAETPFDSGYEAMYRAAWDFHLETDDRLRAAAGDAREEIWLRAAAAMGEKVAAFPDQPFAAALFAAVWQELERRYAGE